MLPSLRHRRAARQHESGRPREAVVLSGGGSLGAAQVGALRALFEAGIRPDLFVGCSVGALNAAFLAVDPTLDRLDELSHDLRLAAHYRLDAARAHLLERAGEREKAIAAFELAARRTASVAERDYLQLHAARLREGNVGA